MGSSRKQSVKAGSATTNSVQRSFAILEFLNASRRGWNISELSRKLDIPKSSTHVLINVLSGLGYIQQMQLSNRFQLSPKLHGLGRRALHATPLSEIVLPHLHWLVQQTSLTAHAGILEKRHVVFIQKVDGQGMVKFDTYIGKCSPLHCTSLGKALLSSQTPEMLQSMLSKYTFDRFTRKTMVSLPAFMSELERVREQGYAVDNEEEELGVRCVASPIVVDGAAVGAVSVTGTVTQIPPESVAAVGEMLRTAAWHVKAQLCNRPEPARIGARKKSA
jgi:IclR family transcriptional regulator, KDG regulon repressor